MNFIRQMNAFFDYANADKNITPHHISLYFALFQRCNRLRLKQTFCITRARIMNIAKIGSKDTYYNCLHYLHQAGYIHYQQSTQKGSHASITIIPLENTVEKTQQPPHFQPPTNTPPCPTIGTPPIPDSVQPCPTFGTTPVPDLVPLYKQTKQQKTKESTPTPFSPPSKKEVENHFTAAGATTIEAQLFYHHYTATGWLLGKSPIKQWKAVAEKWLLKNQHHTPPTSATGIIPPNKNYGEAL